MGDEMKVADVGAIQHGIGYTNKESQKINEQLVGLGQSIQGLVALQDALQGQAGGSIRDFFYSVHLFFLTNLTKLINDYLEALKKVGDSLHKYEAQEKGYINEQYLTKELIPALKDVDSWIESVTKGVNGSISNIDHIMPVSRLDSSNIQQKISDADKYVDTTIEDLYTFDDTSYSSLNGIDETLAQLTKSLKELASTYNKNNPIQDITKKNMLTTFNKSHLVDLKSFTKLKEDWIRTTQEKPIKQVTINDEDYYIFRDGSVAKYVPDGVGDSGHFELIKQLPEEDSWIKQTMTYAGHYAYGFLVSVGESFGYNPDTADQN
ncbi:hypothetical protein A374_18960, partial [Fictibacillus macauensis ZFHKF-1]